jgi:hypothetical protein
MLRQRAACIQLTASLLIEGPTSQPPSASLLGLAASLYSNLLLLNQRQEQEAVCEHLLSLLCCECCAFGPQHLAILLLPLLLLLLLRQFTHPS